MIKRILYIVNLLLVLLLLLAQSAAYVSPSTYDKLSLLTYSYPFLVLINAIFCILWLFVKIRFTIVPLAALILQINSIPLMVNYSKENLNLFSSKNAPNILEKEADILENAPNIFQADTDSVKSTLLNFATYNVCGFGYASDDRNATFDSVLALLKSHDIDVVAMQDFPRISVKHAWHNKLLAAGYKYFFSLDPDGSIVDKSVIYSKFPLGKTGGLLAWAEEPGEFIFADVRKGNKEFRIYNFHLASYLLSQEEHKLHKVKDKESIVRKLLAANRLRAKEVNDISETIATTEKPFLVVGDFNDTPFSYTYHKLSKHLSDCFVKKGRGFGITYNQLAVPFRIDYVLASKDFTTMAYDSPKCKYSDHFPVFVVLKLQ
ncbi:MAG: endonuclease/exonuclease/phosphatase family protein [Bacteroidales bacterium]|jgi:endonuclease/exonuclease/phosphatase (EEP) superfamily protein YafD|nr:endonuclease/exonuclease/phosphatase family protein [Bacteroidales bacterium]